MIHAMHAFALNIILNKNVLILAKMFFLALMIINTNMHMAA